MVNHVTLQPVESPWRVKPDFQLVDAPTALTQPFQQPKQVLAEHVAALTDLQRRFYADGRYALLLIFQAMDAAGKDSTIRHVFSGVNPAGFRVRSFKQPSHRELRHDYLWRTTRVLPERGYIGIFNRSQYEEVLVLRVHPEYLAAQGIDPARADEAFWHARCAAIAAQERQLADCNTVIMKFFLNVSRDEQARRFIGRIDEADKNWKFAVGDVAERAHWSDYMHAYEQALRQTSTDYAPWYAIPADSKKQMRATVAGLVRARLESLGLRYPELPDDEQAALPAFRRQLEAELNHD